MPTPPTTAGTARGLRDRPLGKVALLLAVLLVAFLVSRSCGATETRLDKDEAIELAKREVPYSPDRVQVRYLKRGLKSRGFWAVSLSTVRDDGSLDKVRVVVLDAQTGDVAEVRAPQR